MHLYTCECIWLFPFLLNIILFHPLSNSFQLLKEQTSSVQWGLLMPGANSLIVCPKDSSIRHSIKKYYEKGRHFEYVNKDETWNKHFIWFKHKFKNHNLISIFDLDVWCHCTFSSSPLHTTAVSIQCCNVSKI